MYTAKDYSKLIGMEGLSANLLNNHFTLYQGHVTNTNKLIEIFPQMLKDDQRGYPGVRRAKEEIQLGVQWNAPPRVLLREPGGQIEFANKDGRLAREAR